MSDKDHQDDTPLALAAERAALMRMYIELTVVIRDSIWYPNEAPESGTDANLAVVAVAVFFGHSIGAAMNQSNIADLTGMPRSTVINRLNLLVEHGIIERRDDGKYYIEASRAVGVPFQKQFTEVLARGFAVLGPYLEAQK